MRDKPQPNRTLKRMLPKCRFTRQIFRSTSPQNEVKLQVSGKVTLACKILTSFSLNPVHPNPLM
jgi:hypothetical protein